MATYTTITDTQVDPEAPITSELMSALRDNPIAIAQGASGAPKITVAALNVQTRSFSASISPSGQAVFALSDNYAFHPKLTANFGAQLGATLTTNISSGNSGYVVFNSSSITITVGINWRYIP